MQNLIGQEVQFQVGKGESKVGTALELFNFGSTPYILVESRDLSRNHVSYFMLTSSSIQSANVTGSR